ncbi:DUF5412 family protein [Niallia sp. FSL R7-0271]|uniref:DUF5412 family protein n=1 Tax=Niallia sp. FSL R7-0271 TaxID=2921678 RepID=UPI0030F54597
MLNIIGFLLSILTILLLIVSFIYLIIYFLNKKHFPKKLLLVTLTSSLLFIGVLLYGIYFFSFDNINKDYTQKGPEPLSSPTEKYTANAFYELYGGAAGGVNVWIEVTNNEENKVKTIYYSDAKSTFSMHWKDEDTLYIVNNDPEYPNSNRSIELEVDKEIYHENGLACTSWLMKDEFEQCYQN